MRDTKASYLTWMMGVLAFIFQVGTTDAYASTETQQAAQLFREGRAAMKSKDFSTAAAKLAASQKLDPSPGTLLNLAISEEELGQLVEAWEHLQQVLAALPSGDPRKPIAEKRVAALDERLPHLVLRVQGLPSDAVVDLDGRVLAREDLTRPIALNPGVHHIQVTSSVGRQHRRVRIEEGQRTKLSLSVATDRRDETDELEATEGASPTAAYIALGVGAAGVLTGSYLWMALNKKQDIIDNNCDAEKHCTPRGMDAVDEGNSLMPLYAGAWLVGAIGLTTGAYLLLDRDEADETNTTVDAAALPGGAVVGISGRF